MINIGKSGVLVVLTILLTGFYLMQYGVTYGSDNYLWTETQSSSSEDRFQTPAVTTNNTFTETQNMETQNIVTVTSTITETRELVILHTLTVTSVVSVNLFITPQLVVSIVTVVAIIATIAGYCIGYMASKKYTNDKELTAQATKGKK